jgi:hypothetical protein
MLDLSSYGVNDCTVSDMRLDGSAGGLTVTSGQGMHSGILCSLRRYIARVSLYDIWGWTLWIAGSDSAYTRVIYQLQLALNYKGNGQRQACAFNNGRYRWRYSSNSEPAPQVATQAALLLKISTSLF